MVVCKFFQRGNCYYGNSCNFEHNYDSKYSYRAPQLGSAKNSHTVTSANKSSGQINSASLLFRSAVQNSSTFNNISSSHNLTQNQHTRPSVFDRLGPQPSSVFSKQNNQGSQASSIFAQANQSVFGQTQTAPNLLQTYNQSPNVFQTQNPPTNKFQTQNQTTVFHIKNQAQNAFQSQNQLANPKALFAQATQNIFGQQSATTTNVAQQKNSLSSNAGGNVFQISNIGTSNVFGKNNVFEQNEVNDDDVYSKIGDLSQSDIDAFESEDFRLGFIPELPPPKLLCAM